MSSRRRLSSTPLARFSQRADSLTSRVDQVPHRQNQVFFAIVDNPSAVAVHAVANCGTTIAFPLVTALGSVQLGVDTDRAHPS